MEKFKATSLVLALLSVIACFTVGFFDSITKDLILIFGFREAFVEWVLFLLVPFFLGAASFALFIEKIKNGEKHKGLWLFGAFVLVGSAVLMFCLSKDDDIYVRAHKVVSPGGRHSVSYIAKDTGSGRKCVYYRRVGTFTYEYLFASDEPVEIEWGDAMLNVDGKQFPCSPYDDK
ncbi:hypothetical protein SAMN02910265_02756 [Ruminococcus flavefaciens]|uniref:Uncharacterized protein n=1 Tax=Ruminococcus flavefaciens TaxID=1265 RepID=A0A1H6L6Y3_RUMFL|nr:hypothetical protein [Ruminococcus flavefaciens]SEH79972.1 hypothetical protein SAMN02910265_02756 [Ruminococcus flavefaciens]